MTEPYKNPYAEFNLPSLAQQKVKDADGELTDLHTAWKTTPDMTTKATLIKALQPTIDPHLRQYGENPVLRGRAKLMAIQALDTYDPAKGTLKQHVGSAMRGLQRQNAQSQQIITIPERVAIEQQQLRESTAELESELSREPTDTEISDRTGIPAKRLAYIRQVRRPTNTGKFIDEQGGQYLPDSESIGTNVSEDMWRAIVYNDLSSHDQLIMEHTLGLNGKPVLENTAIASKLRVSPGAISQRKTRIQAMLDERYM